MQNGISKIEYNKKWLKDGVKICIISYIASKKVKNTKYYNSVIAILRKKKKIEKISKNYCNYLKSNV